jgi:hypothetical protein
MSSDSFVIRLEVDVVKSSIRSNMHVRNIATTCFQSGYAPMCGISIVYKGYTRHFVDLKVTSRQIYFIKSHPTHGEYRLNYIGLSSETHQNVLRGSEISWFESYDNSVLISPYDGGEPGMYRDEYSDNVSYAELAMA